MPWHGALDPGSVPGGAVAGLGLVTWAVLGSWVVLGWRTVAVEVAPGRGLRVRASDVPTYGLESGNGAEPGGWGTSPSRGL